MLNSINHAHHRILIPVGNYLLLALLPLDQPLASRRHRSLSPPRRDQPLEVMRPTQATGIYAPIKFPAHGTRCRLVRPQAASTAMPIGQLGQTTRRKTCLRFVGTWREACKFGVATGNLLLSLHTIDPIPQDYVNPLCAIHITVIEYGLQVCIDINNKKWQSRRCDMAVGFPEPKDP